MEDNYLLVLNSTKERSAYAFFSFRPDLKKSFTNCLGIR